jgi:hypothetical protein
VLRGFRIVYVFDVTQTDGDPLPDVAPDLLTGAAPDRLWEQLSTLVRADGFTVERGDCRGANGYTRFDDRTAHPRRRRPGAKAGQDLAHELGHIRAGHDTRFADAYHRSVDCRGIAEIEAESIAYLITTTAGLDAGDYSVPYVTGWSGGDPALLRSTATFVLATATEIDNEVTKLRTETTRTIAWNTPQWQPAPAEQEPPMVDVWRL